ncbi:MAG TPA: glycosyltransferase family 2 protein [Bacteroidia bacterium]|jgi:glycosyltransferase involved in cell wall biosynthesis|nr:glycosyltransferase family 2 protein [Bacteroidia bacterium]
MSKVTIITVCYNNADTLESTMQSVFAQDYGNLEYIVIDGGSTDGTKTLLDKYKDKINICVSEKDAGIYEAMNKGLSRSSGDIIGFLHADDFYPAPNIISTIAKAFDDSKADCIYGDLQYVDRSNTGKITRNWKAGDYTKDIFLKGWMPPHPTFFLKKKWYDEYGNYNTTFSISADYELMLRMLHKHNLTPHYIPQVLVQMRTGGTSNRSLARRITANMEDRKAWKINKLKPGLLTLFVKPLGKIGQYI